MKVKSPAPKLGTLAAALAQRVANITAPQGSTSVFDKLKEAHSDNGIAIDPRSQFKSTVPSIGMPMPGRVRCFFKRG